MYRNLKTISFMVLMVFLLTASLYAGRKKEINESFDAKKSVKINTISGDCIVEVGDNDRIDVRLVYTYSPEENFEPLFRSKGDHLCLEEDMYGSTRGSAVWTLTVPASTRINFSSASGDFEASGLKERIIVDVASGDIETDNCRGEFELNTASGDIEVLNTVIDEVSSFDVASGDIYVELAESSDFDLFLSTASGRAVLDYNGHEVKGYFELTAREDRGDIRAPFSFDHEEYFERYDRDYVRKSFTRGGDHPEIIIETASGKAILED